MATASELLAGMEEVDRTLVIDNYLRTINIPSTITNLGVEYDDEVLTLDFRMPRYVSDTDLADFSIRINYVNAIGESDVYSVHNPEISNDYIAFTWLVGPTATRYKGNTMFNVCLKTIDSDGIVQKEFNTTITSLPVLEGLEVDNIAVTMYSDLIEQWRQELFGIGDTEEASIKAVSQNEQANIVNTGKRVLDTIPPDYATAVSMTDNADRTKSDAIVCSTRGEVIRVDDSSDDYLRGLRIFGKTTPDYFIDEVAMASVYQPDIYIYGKNLACQLANINSEISGVSITASVDSSEILLNGVAEESFSTTILKIHTLSPGTYTISVYGVNLNDEIHDKLRVVKTAQHSTVYADYVRDGSPKSFTLDAENHLDIVMDFQAGSIYEYRVVKIQLEHGDTATEYERSKPKQRFNFDHTSFERLSLRGVPVDNGGNYMDSNGQQWICDEIDFARGVYIKRTAMIEFHGGEGWRVSSEQIDDGTRFDCTISGADPALLTNVVSNHFGYHGVNAETESAWVSENSNTFSIITSNATTVDELETHLSSLTDDSGDYPYPLQICYTLKTPIETEIEESLMRKFHLLHTNVPTTNIIIVHVFDETHIPTIELTYNADTKTWLENLPKADENQVRAAVDAWLEAHYPEAEKARF